MILCLRDICQMSGLALTPNMFLPTKIIYHITSHSTNFYWRDVKYLEIKEIPLSKHIKAENFFFSFFSSKASTSAKKKKSFVLVKSKIKSNKVHGHIVLGSICFSGLYICQITFSVSLIMVSDRPLRN